MLPLCRSPTINCLSTFLLVSFYTKMSEIFIILRHNILIYLGIYELTH